MHYYGFFLGEEIISRVCEMGLRLRQLRVSLPGKVLLLQLPCHFPGIILACQVDICLSACQVTERQLSRYSLPAVNHSARVAEDLLSGILFQLSVGSHKAQGKLSRYSLTTVGQNQGVTKRCRLSLLTNSALVYESQCGGMGGRSGLSQ
jgi:hypothetical protein